MNNKEILGHIDHTLLQPTSTWEQIQVICEDAIRFGTASVCIPPTFVERVHKAYPDSGAEMGIGGIWYGIGCALSYVVLSFTINDFLYKKGYISLSDFLRERYGDRITTLVYSLSTAFSFIGNMAAQIMAGKALFIALGLDGNVGAVVITIVVLLYSQIAGLWGAFATSVVQTGIILLGLIGTTIFVLMQGGVGAIVEAVESGALPKSFLPLYHLTRRHSSCLLFQPVLRFLRISAYFRESVPQEARLRPRRPIFSLRF